MSLSNVELSQLHAIDGNDKAAISYVIHFHLRSLRDACTLLRNEFRRNPIETAKRKPGLGVMNLTIEFCASYGQSSPVIIITEAYAYSSTPVRS